MNTYPALNDNTWCSILQSKNLFVFKIIFCLIFFQSLFGSITSPVLAGKLEADSITLNDTTTVPTFTTLTFKQTYNYPPLVFAIAEQTDAEPCSIRIRNITTTGCEVCQVEPEGNATPGPHAAMTIHYLAIERGRHALPDGTVIRTFTHDTQSVQSRLLPAASTDWDTIYYIDSEFGSNPAVLAQIQTMNNETGVPPNMPPVSSSRPWLTVAIDNVGTTSFDIALERSEVTTGSVTVAETIGLLLVEGGMSGSFIDYSSSTINYETIISGNNIRGWDNGCTNVGFSASYANPMVFANKNTRNGADGGWLRRCNLATNLVGLTVDEDQFTDAERNHTNERAGILVFSQPFTGRLDPAPLFGTNPGFEADAVTLNDTTTDPSFTFVKFRQTYNTPPLVFAIASEEGENEPCAIRVDNITTTGCQICQVEADANFGPISPGPHGAMTIHYLAIAPGLHSLDDGTVIYATTYDTQTIQCGGGVGCTAGWDTINYADAGFKSTPAVIAQIQTFNNESGTPPVTTSTPWLTVAMSNINSFRASIALERSEVASGSVTGTEQIGLVLIEAGRHGSFTDNNGTSISYESIITGASIDGWDDGCYLTNFNYGPYNNPMIMANKNTRNGGDGGWLRRCDLDPNYVGLTVDEDIYVDNRAHPASESASILIFSEPFDIKTARVNISEPRRAINFIQSDGDDDYIQVNDDNTLDLTDEGTMEAWINVDSFSDNAGIVMKAGTTQASITYGLTLGSALYGNTSSEIGFVIDNSGGAQYWLGGAATLNTGQWYHIAGAWDTTPGAGAPNMLIYINGVLDNSIDLSPMNAAAANTENILIGGQAFTAPDVFFDGQIDEVRVWNVPRTEAEIRTFMCRKLIGNETGLSGYWRLNEDAGTACYDGSGNGNTASMTNMDPDTERICSEAPIGDESAFDYKGLVPAEFNPSLYHPDGDFFTATGEGPTSADWNHAFSGIQVYRVDSTPVYPPDLATSAYVTPNGLTPPYPPNAAVYWSSIDYYRYWGVFITDWPVTAPTYEAKYSYLENPLVPVDESVLALAKRDNYCDRTWADANAALDTTANTLTKSGETGTEYVLGGKDSPLAISLASFYAEVDEYGGCMTISWVTATEIDTIGFQLWRSTEKKGEYTLLPDSFIAAEAISETMGATYEFLDCEVDLDKNISYYYKLEEIDLDDSGKNPMYGPIGPVSETLGASQQENTPRSTNSDDSGCFIKSLKQP